MTANRIHVTPTSGSSCLRFRIAFGTPWVYTSERTLATSSAVLCGFATVPPSKREVHSTSNQSRWHPSTSLNAIIRKYMHQPTQWTHIVDSVIKKTGIATIWSLYQICLFLHSYPTPQFTVKAYCNLSQMSYVISCDAVYPDRPLLTCLRRHSTFMTEMEAAIKRSLIISVSYPWTLYKHCEVWRSCHPQQTDVKPAESILNRNGGNTSGMRGGGMGWDI